MEEMQSIASFFSDILEENQRKIMLAREANFRLVRTIANTAISQEPGRGYGGSGVLAAASQFSVALNQTA